MSDRRVVLITGAAAGIGLGIARVLADRDWHVIVNDLDPAETARLAGDLGGTGLAADITDDPARLIADAVAVAGRLDGLVNNAGIILRAPLASIEAEKIDRAFEVNLRAMMLLSKEALPHLSKRQGSIVNLASIAAVTPQVEGGVYSATKAGVIAFTRQAAAEWGIHGVRVNAIGPGMVRTAMAEVVYADRELYEKRRAMIPLGRIGTPEDMGRVTAFLLSEDAAYVSGQTLMVDGGFTQTLIAQIPQPDPMA